MSSWYKIILIILVLVVVINDIGVVLTGYYYIGDMGKRVAEAAIANYKVSKSEDEAVVAAQEKADNENVILTGFQVTNNMIRISVALPPRKTWVAHRVNALKPYISAKALVELPLN